MKELVPFKPGELTSENYVLVVFLLDASNSMRERGKHPAAIEAFNRYKQGLQRLAIKFSLATFAVDLEMVCSAADIAKVPDLTDESYRHQRGTALFDAVGDMILDTETAIQKMTPKPAHTLFVILTDGEDNSSWRWTRNTLHEIIDRKVAEGWRFQLLGIGVDAEKVAESTGSIHLSENALSFAGNALGVQEAIQRVAEMTKAFTSGGGPTLPEP